MVRRRAETGTAQACRKGPSALRVLSAAALVLLLVDSAMLYLSGGLEAMLLFVLGPMILCYGMSGRAHVGLRFMTRSELRARLVGRDVDLTLDPANDAYTPRAFRVFTVVCLAVGIMLFQPWFYFRPELLIPQVQQQLSAKYGLDVAFTGMVELPQSVWDAGEASYRFDVGGRAAVAKASIDGFSARMLGDDLETQEAAEAVSALVEPVVAEWGEVTACVSWPEELFSGTPVIEGRVGEDGWLDGLRWCSVAFVGSEFDLDALPRELPLPGDGTVVVACLAEGAEPSEVELRAQAEDLVLYKGIIKNPAGDGDVAEFRVLSTADCSG